LVRVGRDPGKLRFGLCRRPHADDAVAALVAIAQLALDIPQRICVFVNGEKDRTGHAWTLPFADAHDDGVRTPFREHRPRASLAGPTTRRSGPGGAVVRDAARGVEVLR